MADLYRVVRVSSGLNVYYRVISPVGIVKGEWWADNDDCYRRALELACQLNDAVSDTESEVQ